MERAWAQELLLYRASCRAHYYPDLLKKKASHESVVSSLTEEMQLIPSPPWKSTKPFCNRNANLKRSWLKANRQACQTVFLGFSSLVCWRCSLILNFCLGLSFQLAKMVTRKQHPNLIVPCTHWFPSMLSTKQMQSHIGALFTRVSHVFSEFSSSFRNACSHNYHLWGMLSIFLL